MQDCKDQLNKKLVLIEDLWQKLVHVKWNQKSFAVLGQLTRDMAQTARKGECANWVGLISRLEQHVNDCIAAGQIPDGSTQERLTVLLQELRHALRPAAAVDRAEAKPPLSAQAEIMLIAAGADVQPLILKLEEAGLQVRHLDELAQLRETLARTTPAALLVDVDFPQGPCAGIEAIARLRSESALTMPVFFLAQHGDLATRLEAVRAGGAGYFTRPVDVPALSGRLHAFALGEPYRVLIVDDIPADAQALAQILEARGIVTQRLAQPIQLMLALHRFQPELVVLSLDLQELNGLELVRVIRQHETYADLPVILLATVADLNRRLAALEAGEDELLGKPVARDPLCAAVIQRLRRARQVRRSTLTRRDAISTRYNHQHFPAQPVHIPHPGIDQESRESDRQRLVEEIHEAIEQERMGLVFQPIVSLRGDPSERYEVFLRMRNREGLELLPESVFAVARQHRLDVALDRWVIAQCIRLLQEHRNRSTTLFINISPATFQDKSLQAWLGKRLEQTRVDARDLIFEVAEPIARQYLEALRKFLEDIKTLGCGFCLERFGNQADSRRLLEDLPANYVKLDAGFVQGLADNRAHQRQLQGLVENLKSRRIITIASGVEDLSALPLLWSCGINYVQGFFLQRPDTDMSYDFTGGVV